MKKDQVSKNLRALAESLGDEASTLPCEACQEYLPMLVDAEMEGEQVSTRFPAVWNHLLVCDDCSELYADLLEVAMLEEAGEMPVPAGISDPDLSFLPTPAVSMSEEWLTRIARAIAEDVAPASLPELDPTARTFFGRISSLEAGVRLGSASELTLAFGAEASPALSILAATYSTTQFAIDKIGSEGQPLRLTDKQARRLERAARIEGRRMGLDRTDARTFARAYVEAVQGQAPAGPDEQEE